MFFGLKIYLECWTLNGTHTDTEKFNQTFNHTTLEFPQENTFNTWFRTDTGDNSLKWVQSRRD